MRFVYCVWVLARTRTKFLSSTALPAPHGRQVGGCALFVRNSGRATLKQPWFILDSVCAACNANAERVSLRQKHWGKLRRLRNEFRHSHHVSLAKKYHSTRARHRVPRSGPLYLCRVDTYVQYTCTRPIPLPAISCSGHSNLELGICQRDPLNNQVRCKMWG
jgi:hypothetical protein